KLMSSKTFEKEPYTSRYSEYPYAMKFVGAFETRANLFFVNPVAKNGTLLEYVGDRASIYRPRLSCLIWDVKVKQTLGAAGHHMTTRAKLSPSGAQVVIKEINLSKIHAIPPGIDVFKHIGALWSLQHENIVELIGCSVPIGLDTMSLVTHQMASGNLVDYVHKELDMNRRFELFNVLVTDSGKAVLDDYVLDVINGQYPSARSRRSSVRWSSPEVNLGNSALIQSDTWSWACVVLQVVTGDRPYLSIGSEDHIKLVMSFGKRGFLIPGASHELADIPDVLMRLLRRCWEFEPSQRPSAQECVGALEMMLNTDPDVRSLDDDISHSITQVSLQPICINGRFGDVFKGIHKTMGDVALKRLRIAGAAVDDQVIRLCETSDAVSYLHRENIVHGDIKAGNILISDDDTVLLCDFGLARSTRGNASLILRRSAIHSNQGQQVLTGRPPFPHLKNEVAVFMAVYQMDERPSKIPMESNG
ncbi:hypothetical protein FRC01_001958, partial [Tulasnella sp. 417]